LFKFNGGVSRSPGWVHGARCVGDGI
jgi:hypothetical protein